MNSLPLKVLLIGASRGLGKGLWRAFSEDGAHVTAVGRSLPDAPSPVGNFIEADLTVDEGIKDICSLVKSESFNCVVYVAGIWEQEAFAKLGYSDMSRILATNLLTPMKVGQALVERNSTSRCNLVFIGSTCGLENEGSSSVAYVSSKFGLRGLTHSLREVCRGKPIYVTCLSPGSIEPGTTMHQSSDRIPHVDIYEIIRCLLRLSPMALVKEIIVPALSDIDV
ncbi:SDR family oxidoreductase [Pseudomonas syringae pv. theae]|uniref:SDR family oxidoreductase n=1 Tax=Pseudomonas syringae TaxID=317 RepID=UPI0006E522C6|nr:SDR family oxidoreductase [Pseudomonas syringae]KPZ30809.1 hypothetical protein AN901_201783 [Pseudomonas syringae pv. theae]GKQ28055.1 SDR family oxidoreductase [Pseudomonas syringae pv. theae]GKQ44018.1 SDR family oxidoreductase [Pseudomonas syringae pv. theae]GKS08893.1 SDR family oxidoreductase [Pseudomonas syringae pv. theae]